MTSVEYGTTKQVTHTPEAERGLSFGADNRSLVYSSERNGKRDLYIAKISRKEDLNISELHLHPRVFQPLAYRCLSFLPNRIIALSMMHRAYFR